MECDYFAVIANIVVAAAAVAPVAVELASSSPPPPQSSAPLKTTATQNYFVHAMRKCFAFVVVVVVSAVIADALVAGIWRYVYATYVGSPFAFVCTLLLQGSSSLRLLSALSRSLCLSVIALNVIIASFDFVSLFFPSSSPLLAAAVIVFAWLRCVAQVY